MSRDLTIRLLGRPQVSTDKRTGYKKLMRKFVVEGYRASQAGIADSENPLFLPAGSTDEEFTSYYLVDQNLEPASGTLDKAYLSRVYLELGSAYIADGYVQNNDLIKVRRQYTALRNDDAVVGYGSSWSNHPSESSSSVNPWSYAPERTLDAPAKITYGFDNADTGGFQNTPAVRLGETDTDLKSFLGTTASSQGTWLKGSATVQRVGSELDIWTVEWVTHGSPYWVAGTGSTRSKASNSVTVVDFDHLGLKLSDVGGTISQSSVVKTKTYVFFTVGEDIPDELMQISGGASSQNISSSVNVDLYIKKSDTSGFTIKQHIKNAVWNSNTNANITFPTTNGDGVVVANKSGYSIDFDQYKEPSCTATGGEASGGFDSEETISCDYALYQGQPIYAIGGRISFTSTDRLPWVSANNQFGGSQTRVDPIFSHGTDKIWRVAITYVGE